jgi:hypothetical protein
MSLSNLFMADAETLSHYFGPGKAIGAYESESSPTIYYIVQGSDGVIYCTCRGWISSGKGGKTKHCKHTDDFNAQNQRAQSRRQDKILAEFWAKQPGSVMAVINPAGILEFYAWAFGEGLNAGMAARQEDEDDD